MKRIIIITLVILTALTAVSCGRNRNKNDLLVSNESMKGVETDKYSGVVPAADGPGIRYEVVLIGYAQNENGLFHMRRTYIEAENGKDMPFDIYGRYVVVRSNGERVLRLTSFDEEEPVVSFLISSTTEITLLDQQMNRINTGLNYTLKKEPK